MKNIKYNIDGHHHGIFIKEARLRLGYRMVEVANGICDVSYLSKVESGTIVPPPAVFLKLADKLRILFPTKAHQCPIDIFRMSLYQEDLSIIKSYLADDVFHHYEILMINFFQAVLNNDLFEAFNLKKIVDQFSHHFSEKEEQNYLLFSGIYFFKNFEWERGRECFKKSLELAASAKIEDPYLCLQLAKYYFQIQKVYLGFSYLERATAEFRKIFQKEWVFKCDILWCQAAVRNGDPLSANLRLDEVQKLVDPLKSHLQWRDLFNVLGMIYEKRQQNSKAEEYYIKSIEEKGGKVNEEFIVEIMRFYYERQKYNQLINLTEKLNLGNFRIQNRLLIDFYYFKIADGRSENFEEFLRKDAIPFAMKSLDFQNAMLYTKELMQYNRNEARYKKVTDVYYKWETFSKEIDSAGII